MHHNALIIHNTSIKFCCGAMTVTELNSTLNYTSVSVQWVSIQQNVQ